MSKESALKAWQLCRIGKAYRFEAAHHLPKVPDWHKCHRVHGHNYKVEVEIRNEIAPVNGFCGNYDFFDVDKIIKPIIDQLDHRLLNEIEGLENPTAELIAQWILQKANAELSMFFSVKVWETDDCWAQVVNKGGWWQKEHRE